MHFLIISGLSGAGKSRAAVALEDMGYYCVDNLPADIIPQFVQFCLAANGEFERVAMVTDVRSGLTAESYAQTLQKLETMGCEYATLFLNASTQTIIQRYKETRRSHPLERDGLTLQQAVELERKLLEPIMQQANETIDTSNMSPEKMRGELLSYYGDGIRSLAMSVTVMSFGYKYGLPMDADLVLDARLLPNPYYIDELRKKTGLDQAVCDYVFSFPQSEAFLQRFKAWLEYSLPYYADSGKTTLNICVGCTGGHHRSVALAVEFGNFIAKQGYVTVVHHRDLYRE